MQILVYYDGPQVFIIESRLYSAVLEGYVYVEYNNETGDLRDILLSKQLYFTSDYNKEGIEVPHSEAYLPESGFKI